ncbi:hypothetical protein [Psychrobacter sp. S1-30-MNA-CIBAN-0213]
MSISVKETLAAKGINPSDEHLIKLKKNGMSTNKLRVKRPFLFIDDY